MRTYARRAHRLPSPSFCRLTRAWAAPNPGPPMSNPESNLATELASLANVAPALRARLDAAGFRDAWLLELAATLSKGGDAAARRDARNRVSGDVRAPAPEELPAAPAPDSPAYARLAKIGNDAIHRGELA